MPSPCLWNMGRALAYKIILFVRCPSTYTGVDGGTSQFCGGLEWFLAGAVCACAHARCRYLVLPLAYTLLLPLVLSTSPFCPARLRVPRHRDSITPTTRTPRAERKRLPLVRALVVRLFMMAGLVSILLQVLRFLHIPDLVCLLKLCSGSSGLRILRFFGSLWVALLYRACAFLTCLFKTPSYLTPPTQLHATTHPLIPYLLGGFVCSALFWLPWYSSPGIGFWLFIFTRLFVIMCWVQCLISNLLILVIFCAHTL